MSKGNRFSGGVKISKRSMSVFHDKTSCIRRAFGSAVAYAVIPH